MSQLLFQMKLSILFLSIFPLVFMVENLQSMEHPKDDFSDFRKEPEYILYPTEEQKTYFDAYDRTMQQWETAYEELYVPTSHGTAHIILTGAENSETLILFHGLSSSSTMWYPNAKILSENYRLFAIDLIIEPGKSNLTRKFKNIEEVSDWYQEVISKLNLESYHLIGPSRGGWFAMDLTLRYPDKVKSTILLSPVQAFIWIPPSADLFKNMANVFYSDRKRVSRTMSTLSNNAEKIDDKFLQQYRLGKKHDSLRKFVTGMQPFSKKKLKTTQPPVYLLVGDEDMFNNRRSLKKAKNFIPNFSGEIIPDSGHFLSVDQTAVINRKIMDFLERHSEFRER